MKSIKLILSSLASLLTLSLPAQAQNLPPVTPSMEVSVAPVVLPQVARFIYWLDQLDKNLLGLTPDEAPDALVASGARAITFNLQALGRLYAAQNPEFGRIRDKFKSLEDGIGNYQKFVDLQNDAVQRGSSEAVINRLKTNRDNNRKALVKTLIATRFITVDGTAAYTQSLRAFLESYSWKSAQADRNEMLINLIAELEIIRSSIYDLSRLEAGNGIHEFRRKMRWFSMEARALNGMVTLLPKDSECPIAVYKDVVQDSIAKTKYAVLPGAASEVNPVQISPCLYVQVARLIEDVNQVKARAELDDNLSEEEAKDTVGAEDQAKVEAMLNDSLESGLFERLQTELSNGLVN